MTKLILSGLLYAAMSPSSMIFAYEYGPDPRYTAAPGDDPLACSTGGCRTGLPKGGPLNLSGGGVIATFSNGSFYTPGGAPITITVSVTDPQNIHYGFQMTARLQSNLANGQAGDFTAGRNQIVICDDGSVKIKKCPTASPVEFVEHSYPAGGQVTTAPYTFTWTPPATNVGQVHFYVAGSAVNGNLLADAGDHTYTADYILTPTTFFNGEVSVGTGVYYLQFSDSNPFGYCAFVSDSILYHYDMGYEAFIPGSAADIYLYDFRSGHWWYTSSSLFPYLYDFTLAAWIYYFPDTINPAHYTANPRYFSSLATGQIFNM